MSDGEKKPVPPALASTAFRPGQSGNPSGRPKGLERLVRETVGDDMVTIIKAQIAIATGEPPKNAAGEAMKIPAIKASDMTKAAEWLGDRGWGKAKQTVSIGNEMSLETRDLTKLTAAELDEMIAKAEALADAEEPDGDPSASDGSPPPG